MQERFRKSPDNLEPETFPKPYRSFVAPNDEIELHGPKSPALRVVKRMAAHAASYASTGGCRRGDITAIRDMRTAAFLIWMQKVRPDDGSAILGCKNDVTIRKPVTQRLFTAQITGQRVRFSRTNDRFQNCPNRICVLRKTSFTNCHHKEKRKSRNLTQKRSLREIFFSICLSRSSRRTILQRPADRSE